MINVDVLLSTPSQLLLCFLSSSYKLNSFCCRFCINFLFFFSFTIKLMNRENDKLKTQRKWWQDNGKLCFFSSFSLSSIQNNYRQCNDNRQHTKRCMNFKRSIELILKILFSPKYLTTLIYMLLSWKNILIKKSSVADLRMYNVRDCLYFIKMLFTGNYIMFQCNGKKGVENLYVWLQHKKHAFVRSVLGF